MGSGGPGLGRKPSNGENFRGLRGKPRQSWHLLALVGPSGPGIPGPLKAESGLEPAPHWEAPSQYLMGVWGLLLRRLGERSLGWKENPSLMLSRTEGAT